MLPIKTIHIEEFNGILLLDLDLEGKSFGICGPGLPPWSGPFGFLVHDGPMVDGGDRFGRRGPVAEGAVGPDGVLVASPLLDQGLGLAGREEHLAVQEFVSEASVERLAVAALPGW